MNEMYNRIYDKAIEKGYTIYSLCAKAEVGRARLSDLKSGRIKSLNADAVRRIAAVLGTTSEYLIYGDKDSNMIYFDMDKKIDFREFCERLDSPDLFYLLNAVTAEIQKRNENT